MHEARVVEVPLPTSAASQFHDPASRREVARALARVVSAARHPDSAAEPPHPIGPPADLPADPATHRLAGRADCPLASTRRAGGTRDGLPSRPGSPTLMHTTRSPLLQEGAKTSDLSRLPARAMR